MTEDILTFEDLKKALKLIGKHRRCHEIMMSECGFGMIHGIYRQCSHHHEGMIELAESLHSNTPEHGLHVEELWGVKIVR